MAVLAVWSSSSSSIATGCCGHHTQDWHAPLLCHRRRYPWSRAATSRAQATSTWARRRGGDAASCIGAHLYLGYDRLCAGWGCHSLCGGAVKEYSKILERFLDFRGGDATRSGWGVFVLFYDKFSGEKGGGGDPVVCLRFCKGSRRELLGFRLSGDKEYYKTVNTNCNIIIFFSYIIFIRLNK